jgi:hypothetical protein
VLLFGPGRVLVADPEAGDWPYRDELAMDTVVARGVGTPGAFAFKRVPLNGRTRLLLAVTNDAPGGGPGHTRLVLAPVSEPGRLSFPSSTPQDYMATMIGVDHDRRPGRAGPLGGRLDCANHAGVRGYVSIARPTGPAPPGAPGSLDLPGVPVCYDTHDGTDFLLAGSIAAQMVGVPVNAARAGIVLATDAAHADDCFWDPRAGAVKCAEAGNPANFVAMRHDDGLIAYYFHLKTASVQVVPGEPVACGQKLGYAGSSGESAVPHLHFELRELMLRRDGVLPGLDVATLSANSEWVDPFKTGTWARMNGVKPDFTC